MSHLPKTTEGDYVPRHVLLNDDWINIALCSSRRAVDNVLDSKRWNSEYHCYMSILKGKVTY